MTEDPRISEIRAVMDEWYRIGPPGTPPAKIRAILDREPSAPQVFFPGDTVPAGVVTAFPSDTDPANRMMLTPAQVWRWPAPDLTCIEVPIPSREEWQAAVDRARDARADAEWQHADGVNP